MARLPRYVAPGIPHHVIQRGNDRAPLFAADDDYRFFRECLAFACDHQGCELHAYVFMTNHVHLLMTPSSADGVGKVMQSVARRYVRRFNDTYERTGPLFDGRYRATVVESQTYLFACYRYIELNPVRAGLVDHPGDYPWSSHRANALGVADPIVAPHEEYRALGVDAQARLTAYRAFFDTMLEEPTLATIRAATNNGWALGSKQFRDAVARLLHRRAERLCRGRRPRGNDEIGV